MEKPLDSPASFQPISLTSCVSKLFERIILFPLLFFLETNFARTVSSLNGLYLIKFCSFLSPFRMGLTNPGRALGRSSLLLISLKLSTLSGIPPFSINSFRLASLPRFARRAQSFLSDRRASVVLSKSQKSLFSIPSSCSARIRSRPVLFSLFINDLPASLLSSVGCSLYADDLAIWSSSSSVPTAVEATQGALL